MRDPLVLAIDQGTTGTTALLLDAKGGVRGRGYAELPQHFPRPGWVEHDGREIWDSVLTAIGRGLGAARARRTQVAAIGITNQRETTLLWDRRSGRPVARAIVWQDRRTSERCASLKRRGLEKEVRQRTGLVLDPYFSASKMEWLLRHTDIARDGDLALGTVDDWLLWNLTGRHATDPSNASRTMLFDIRAMAWSAELCALFGVAPSALGEVRPSSGRFGVVRGLFQRSIAY